MKFSITHARAIMGHDIDVKVEADGGETISTVEVELDGFVLGTNVLDPPNASFERSFVQAGDAAPGMDHALRVTASDAHGKSSSATCAWTDAI